MTTDGSGHITSIMVSHFTLLGLLLIATISHAKTPLIVGGQDTTIENYPSIVQVEFWFASSGIWDQECAANILTTYWVLSAAHCFNEWWYNRQHTRIRAGSTYRNTGGSVHYVDFERNHPNYNPDVSGDADISVVRLLNPLVYSPTIQKATIVTQNFIIPDNFPVVHAGWGNTEFGGQASHVLQHVTINVINRDLCDERYGVGTITANMICAGVLDVGGRDACGGDSGGPLYAGNVIVGIVAFGYGCGHPYFPGVSTKVSSYTDWIVANAL